MSTRKLFCISLILLFVLGLFSLWKDYQTINNSWGIIAGIFLSIPLNYLFITKFINNVTQIEKLKKERSIKEYFVSKFVLQLLREANCMSSSTSDKILKYKDLIDNHNLISTIDILCRELKKEKYGKNQLCNLKIQIKNINIEKIFEVEEQILVLLGTASASFWNYLCHDIDAIKHENNDDKLAHHLYNILLGIKAFLEIR